MNKALLLIASLVFIVVVSGCAQQPQTSPTPSTRLCTGDLEIIDTDWNLTATSGIATVDRQPTRFVRFEQADRVFVIDNQPNRPIVIYKDVDADGIFSLAKDENILFAVDGDAGVDASTKL